MPLWMWTSSPQQLINMERLFTALKVLNKITEDKTGFFVAVSESCKSKYLENNKSIITALVGCALRHYLVLESRFSSLGVNDYNSKNACILVTSNLLFAKKVIEKDSLEFLKENIKEEELLNNVNELIKEFLNGKELIPEDLDPNSLEFLSFRYNTPLWLVRMWRKHYGYKIMRKVLIANAKHFNNYAKVNTEMIQEEQFANENPDFSKTDFDGFYLYNQKTALKKSRQYLDKQVYLYPMIFDEMIKDSEADNFRGIAAYAATPNNLISALAAHLSSYVEMDYLIGKQQAYFEIKQEKYHFNLKNVHLYEGSPSNAITCVSRKVHSFFVMPDSSKFFLLRNTPDHFIHFEQSSLDGLIQDQLSALKECGELVEDDGLLIYAVPTLSEKETKVLVNKFLSENKNFILVNDKQAFPFTKYDTTMYYAVMRKVGSND